MSKDCVGCQNLASAIVAKNKRIAELEAEIKRRDSGNEFKRDAYGIKLLELAQYEQLLRRAAEALERFLRTSRTIADWLDENEVIDVKKMPVTGSTMSCDYKQAASLLAEIRAAIGEGVSE